MMRSLECRMPSLPEGLLLAGVSGGADSMALLELLYRRREKMGFLFHVIHVNHGLRGEASDADEAFVRRVCTAKSIPFTVCRLDLEKRRDENAAREARYACYRDAFRRLRAEALVLAHHRDDQTETFLLHLLRGAGTDGLSGMKGDMVQHGMRVIRPLLAFSRSEIRAALTSEGISWREDESNQSDAYARNVLRNRLIPELEKWFPGASEHIASAAELLLEESRVLDREAKEFLDRYGGRDYLYLAPLRAVDPGLQSRILRTWWAVSFAEGRPERALSRKQTDAIRSLVFGPAGKVNLPGDVHCFRGKRALHLVEKNREKAPEPVVFSGKSVSWGEIGLEVLPAGDDTGDGKRMQAVPISVLVDTVIRSRRPGDRITPFGCKYSRKLQDYFTDRGVDEPWRDRIPLLCRKDEVLLAGGIGAGNIPRMDITETNVCLKWSGNMPWLEGQEEI